MAVNLQAPDSAALHSVPGVRIGVSAAETIEQRAQSLHNLAFQHPEAFGAMQSPAEAQAQEQADAAIAAAAVPVVQQVVNGLPKVGRNDPCPCGSGKKYKQCHGRLA